MNSERLLKLAEFLETDERIRINGRFNMGLIVSDPLLRDIRAGTVEPRCGAAACAIGWMPVPFKDEGVTWNMRGEVCYAGWDESFRSAMKFFWIDDDAIDWLFVPTSYPSHSYSLNGWLDPDSIPPEMVAARIREFVASDGKVPIDS